MKTFLFHTLFISLLFFGCTETKTETKQIVSLPKAKKLFLDKIDVNEQVKTIHYQLDSAKISLKDIVDYCQISKNANQNIGLIQVACASMENNLEEQNHDYWAGILYDLKRFYEHLSLLKSEQNQVFIDVGSGNGEKLFASLCLGFKRAIGIEYSDSLVAIANRNLHLFIVQKQVQNHHADAFQVAPTIYQEADFIYLYSPIKDNLAMAKLTQKILQEMKEGTILLEVRFVYGEELKTLMRWDLPTFAGTVVFKKQDTRFYFAEYDNHQTVWKQISQTKD